MTQSLVESAIELTLVLVQRGNVSPEDLQDTLQKTYATLAALKAQEVSGTSISVPIADLSPVDWRKSITRQTIICLECGQLWRQLTRSHLMAHRLDVRSYRAKYGIPQTQLLQLHLAQTDTDRLPERLGPGKRHPTLSKDTRGTASHHWSQT
jgi:predicted transcriptional regulator